MLDVRLKQVLPKIFSYLSDEDYESLSQVDKFGNQQSNKKYQAEIDRYFPYLKATQPQAYLANAVLIYNQERKRFCKAFYELPKAYATRNHLLLSDPECITLLFKALEGNIDALDAALLPVEREAFYIVALSNGHNDAVSRPELTNNGVAAALCIAAGTGYLAAVKSILRTHKESISLANKFNAIKKAATGDHLEVLESLMRDSDALWAHLSHDDFPELVLKATRAGSFKCVRYLFNFKELINIKDHYQYDQALIDLLSRGDYELADLLVSKGVIANKFRPALGVALANAAYLLDRYLGPASASTGLKFLATAASFFVSPLGFVAHSMTVGTSIVANGIQANGYITAYRKYADKNLPKVQNLSDDSRRAFLHGRKAAESAVETLKCWTPLRTAAFKDPEAYKAGYVSKIKGDKELAIRVLRKP